MHVYNVMKNALHAMEVEVIDVIHAKLVIFYSPLCARVVQVHVKHV